MRRQPAVFILILLLLVSLLTGCFLTGSNESNGQVEVVRPNKNPTTLTFWHTHNDEETGTLQAILKDFAKEYPHIQVKLQQVPFSDAPNKYKTVAQAGNAPDVFRADIGWTTELASLGYLMSLDAFMGHDVQAEFLPQALAYTQYNNHIWGVPQVTDCLALMYNKRLLATPPETLEDLIEVSKKLTDPTKDQYGFFYRGDPYWYLPFVWAFGGELINKDMQVKIASPESIAALDYLLELRKTHKVVPASMDFANDYPNQQIGFKNGQYAMIINGPWSTADILDGPEFKDPANLGIARIPKGPAGYGSPVGGHNYVIAANTKNIWASWHLVNFLSRPENQARFALENNLLPTRKATYELPAVKNNPIIQSFKHVLDAANNRPVIPQGGALFVDLKPAYQAVLLEEKSPQQALKEVEEAWQALLKTN